MTLFFRQFISCRITAWKHNPVTPLHQLEKKKIQKKMERFWTSHSHYSRDGDGMGEEERSIIYFPSLARTKRPPSPLDIRKSLSRYVVRSQELVLSPGMGILRGGWPEMTRDMFSTRPCSGPRDCCRGCRLSFWPKMSTFSGSSTLDFISGAWIEPSLNATCLHLEMSARVF